MRLTRAAAVAVLAAGAAVRPAAAQVGTAPIRLGTAANDSAAEPYYAQELGLFKKAGISVEVTTLTNGATIAQAVAGGALDAGGTNLVGLAQAIARGVPFTPLAGGGLYATAAPTTVLATAKASPLRGARDLEGKTVSVPSLKDLTYAAAASWIEANGADPAAVKFVEIPFAEAGAALDRGTVAAAMIAEPALSLASRTTVRVFGKAFDAIAPRFMITAWFAAGDWMKKNPDAAHRLQQALYEAGRWANANHPASAEILAAATKMDRDIVRGMARASYSEGFEPKLLQPPLDVAFKFKLLERPMTAAEIGAKPV